MNRLLQTAALAGLAVLLVGCGASLPIGAEEIPPVTPAPAQGQVPTDTPSLSATPSVEPPTAAPEATETAAPSPTPVAVLTANDVQRITPTGALALVESGTALLYDTRTASEYQVRHAAGAISFPEADVVALTAELPTDRGLIFY
jgi:PBP1b-binding outer membrane lipoprotein LpoB